MLVASSSLDLVDEFKTRLAAAYKIKDLGEVEVILGMRVIRDRAKRTLVLDQRRYIRNIIDTYGMANAHPSSIPVTTNSKLRADDSDDTALDPSVPYREAVGALMYAMTGTRPDIAFAVGLVSRYLATPRESHWRAVGQIFKYLRHTVDTVLTFDGSKHDLQLRGYSDADWGNDLDTRRSVTGYVFMLAGGAVSWRSRRQPTVALSTTEAEYMAAAEATTEAVWLRGFLTDLGVAQTGPTPIAEDNQGAIKLSLNDVNHSRTKHIDIRHHFVRERSQAGDIELVACATKDMAADMLTKGVGRRKQTAFRYDMGLRHRAEVLG
jgi:hypothetical protein